MGRKIFQDFAHILCQKFVEVPSNRDLVNLVLFGDGKLLLDIAKQKATHNGYPISPLPYEVEIWEWLQAQLGNHEISASELVGAVLSVEYQITPSSRKGPIPCMIFDFACTGTIDAPDRTYSSSMNIQKEWGLGQV